MSVFYCEYHGKLEDADYVCCEEHPSGSGMVCADALAEMEEEREEALKEYKVASFPNPSGGKSVMSAAMLIAHSMDNREFSKKQRAIIAKLESESNEEEW